MKIVFTGSGTGGHFYPLIAVAEAIHEIVLEDKLIEPELFFIGPHVIDYEALVEQNIIWKKSAAGRMRKYFSIRNVFDFFKTIIGIIQATFQLYFLYPDVVFSKGGFASFPTTVAARLLNIPVIIHESDARPGNANKITSKWAKAIAISFPGVAELFPGVDKSKFALVGNPIRKALSKPVKNGAHAYLNIKKDIPTILIIGGSQGAKAINSVILDALPKLVQKYQIIHQAGKKNVESVRAIATVILKNNPNAERYRVFGYLNMLAMRMSTGVASLVIIRAGTGSIFETAAEGLPSIVIPIPEDVSHDQIHNAFAYARDGAAVVLKQHNLTEHILLAEIDRILSSKEIQAQMSAAAKVFAKPDAARKIARMLIATSLEHEE